MFETHMCVVGKLITGVDQRRFADGSVVANFRVVSTERRYDRAAGSWADGDKLFLDVTCRRRLAENAFASLVKGDAVVVAGRVYTRTFEHEGQRRSVVTLEAQSVAADLTWCTAVLSRTGPRAVASSDPDPDTAADGPRERAAAQPAPSVAPPEPADGAADGVVDGSRLVGALPGREA